MVVVLKESRLISSHMALIHLISQRNPLTHTRSLITFKKYLNPNFVYGWKMTTVHNIVSNMLLRCNSIPEFVASRYTRFRVQKSIENGRKCVLDAVNRVLFSKQ